jgi:hypothetical protein
MITDSLSLIDYFERIAISDVAPVTATLSTGVGGFAFFREGDTFDIISAATSKLKYPLLWLETPDWMLTNEGSTVEIEVALVALSKAVKDDKREQQRVRNDMMTLLLAVVKRVNHDAMQPRSKFRIDVNTVSAKAIDRIWDSSNWGWRMEFKMTVIDQKVC